MRTKVLFFFLLVSYYSFAAVDSKVVRLRIQDGQTGFADDATVYLDAGTSPAYLGNEDIDKVMNVNPWIPQIYTLTTDSVACMSNANGPFYQSVIIPVGFKVSDSSLYRISANLLQNFDPTTIIRLEDRQLGVMHDLRNGFYSFYVGQAVQDNYRFYLHISYPTAVSTTQAGCNNNNGKIQLVQDTSLVWNSCQLYDASNNLINSFYNITGNFEFTLLSEGNYSVAFTYNTYTTNVPVFVDGNQVITTITINKDTVAVNEPIQFSASTQNTTSYLWDFGEGTTITGVANPTMSYTAVGIYTVILTTANSYGCVDSESVAIAVVETPVESGISDNSIKNFKLRVDGKTLQVLNAEGTKADLQLYTTTGSLLLTETIEGSVSTLGLDRLPAGIYIAALSNSKGRMAQKFVLAQ
ncbi:MAG: PKD domain-containing protein [Chitinophagales bacterium]